MTIVFIWRGIGIVVPIVFGICAWIVSYWFDDTRFGNPDYMGWVSFYTSIVLLLPGLGALVKDEETGKRTYHHFMFIPVIAWSLGLGVLCAYLLLTGDPEPTSTDNVTTTEQTEEVSAKEETVYRTINFLNSSDDSLVCVFKNDVGTEEIGVGSRSWIPFDVIPGACTFTVKTPKGKTVHEFSLNKMGDPTKSSDDYDAGWVQLDGGDHKLIMVDVSPMLPADFKSTDLKSVDWTKQIMKVYDGTGFMEPYIPKDDIGNARVLEPGDYLPSKVGADEKVFALITVPASEELNNEYLCKRFTDLYFE